MLVADSTRPDRDFPRKSRLVPLEESIDPYCGWGLCLASMASGKMSGRILVVWQADQSESGGVATADGGPDDESVGG